ncbi:MAG: rhodanese-like domain-containing protein [Phormidesmis sp.]
MKSGMRALAWLGVKSWVRRSFPSVHMVSSAQLADWLQEKPSLLMIDTRTAAEYAVSHLPGAYRAETVAAAEAIVAANKVETQSGEQRPTVLYCSVGYRSGRLGEALQTAGHRVANLEGSIFQWANEGRSLLSNGQPTQQVHPYNRLWQLLLASSVSTSDVSSGRSG